MSYQKISLELKTKSVKLIAVSKLQTVEKIRQLYSLGQRRFAENYVQEATEKLTVTQDLPDIEWHFIGHLQKNKVKNVVGLFEYIHSVDSINLAEKINQQAQKKNLVQKIFVEVNLSNEATKEGIQESELNEFLKSLEDLKHLTVVGLMTMPPLFEQPELSRPYFKNLKKLASKFGFSELSMGTSSDYQVAIEEGATMVRLGTILFGERPRNQ